MEEKINGKKTLEDNRRGNPSLKKSVKSLLDGFYVLYQQFKGTA